MHSTRRAASTFPPDSTAQTSPSAGGSTLPESSAATEAAPAPSTTSLERSSSSTIAWATSSSETVTTWSTYSDTSGRVSSPGRLTAIPSQIVLAERAPIGRWASSDGGYGAHASDWTPTTRAPGSRSLIAMAIPAISAPPPTATTTRRVSGA